MDTTLTNDDVKWALNWIELARKEKNEKLLARLTAPPDTTFAPDVPRQFWIHLLKQRYFDKLNPAQLIDCLGGSETAVFLIAFANSLHISSNKKRKTLASDDKEQSKYPPPRFEGGKCLWPGCGKLIKGVARDRQRHWYTHTGERPYTCQYCDRAFITPGIRNTHERTHTGETPYPCRHDGCDKAFMTARDRNAHERIHTGETPYPCRYDGCDKCFKQLGSRNTHERLHTGEKPYPCKHKECDYRARNSSNLKKHEESQHTPEGQQRKKLEENRMHKAFLERGETPDYGGEGKNPNQLVDLSCIGSTRAYPDFVFQYPHMLVLRECDEHSHSDRMLSCEMKRMVDIVAALRIGGETRPIVFMRINPHGYKVDGVKKKMPYETRIDNVVSFTKTFQPTLDFTIVYCNFSVCKFPGKEHRLPEILMDKDFPEELKQCAMCLY